jgi:neutral ceramidase
LGTPYTAVSPQIHLLISRALFQRAEQTALTLILALSFSASAPAAPLLAGVASVDITPPPGLPMYGYFPRIKNNQLSTGTLDPLYARVLVLAAGQKRLTLVTLDLGRTFGKASLDQIQQHVSGEYGISFLVVTASHTHSGPNILDEYPPGQTPAWETTDLLKIEAAVGEASRHLARVRIGVGYGSVNIGYNRRVVNPDGTVTMLWTDPTKIPNCSR